MRSITKAWAFLAIISLTLIVLGHHFGGREGLLFALIISLGINFFVYFYEDHRVLSSLGGKTLEGQDSYGIQEMTRRLAIQARIPRPNIVLIYNHAPQAAVVGRGLYNATIVITDGLLAKMDRHEIEAVLAYQIACIKQLNTIAYAVGSFVATGLLFITGALDAALRLLLVEKKTTNSTVAQLFTRLLSPFIGIILRISIRPSLYIAADKLAAQLVSEPKLLARVLWKLDAYSKSVPFEAPISTAHMFMVTPLNNKKWSRFFIAHPVVERRIRDLVGFYPI